MTEPMLTTNVRDDSYVAKGYVSPVDRLHAGLLFTYKPMLVAQVEEYDDTFKGLPPQKRIAVLAATLAGQIKSWSEYEPDAEGKPDPAKPRPITMDTIGRLNIQLLGDLKMIVFGFVATDPLPASDGEQQSEFMRTALAQVAGKGAGLDEVQTNQKN